MPVDDCLGLLGKSWVGVRIGPLAIVPMAGSMATASPAVEQSRRKAAWEAEQARRVYEELALKKTAPDLVQIGTQNPVAEPEKATA